MKKCISRKLYIDGVVDTRPNAKELTSKDNEMIYFGSLVNAVYPNGLENEPRVVKVESMTFA